MNRNVKRAHFNTEQAIKMVHPSDTLPCIENVFQRFLKMQVLEKKRQHQVECYKNKMMAQAWPKLQNGRLTLDLDRLGC